jgi:hypothetical protein
MNYLLASAVSMLCVTQTHASLIQHQTMKFVGIPSLSFAAMAAATSTKFEEQVLLTKLRGTPKGLENLPDEIYVNAKQEEDEPETERGKEWLDSNRSYVDKSLDWSAYLKEVADSVTAESAKNKCELPSQAQLQEGANSAPCPEGIGNVCYVASAAAGGYGTGLSALPSTDDIFEQLGMPKVPATYRHVGCSDCLKEASSNSGLGYWSSVCYYAVLITPA